MREKHSKRTFSLSDNAYEKLDKIVENNPSFNMSQITSYAIMQLDENIKLGIAEINNEKNGG